MMVCPSTTVGKQIKKPPAPVTAESGSFALVRACTDPLMENQSQPNSDLSDGC